MRRALTITFTAALLALAGCDQLGLESASVVAARHEAESKAIGAGCRHAARSIEVCYEMNKRADKAAVFSGWRDMNDYMRENKLDAMPAEAAPVVAEAAHADEEEAVPAKGVKPAAKGEKAEKPEKVEKAEKATKAAAKPGKPAH